MEKREFFMLTDSLIMIYCFFISCFCSMGIDRFFGKMIWGIYVLYIWKVKVYIEESSHEMKSRQNLNFGCYIVIFFLLTRDMSIWVNSWIDGSKV